MPAAATRLYLWSAFLDASPADTDRMWHLLSADERERAARLISPQNRSRFVAARGILRTVLDRGRKDRTTLTFCYSPAGKPSLPDATNPDALRFNLAHSENVLLLGITYGRRIGVDIERIDTGVSSDRLAERFLSPAEYRDWNRLAPAERAAAWFRLWTLKEAYLKAVGVGLAQPLDGIEVSADNPPRLLRIAGDAAEAARWRTVVLPSIAPGFAAAVAVESEAPIEIQHQRWEW